MDSSRGADLRALDAAALIARLEGVPSSRWHLRARVIVGSATFFDAFDALSLAFVLPVLVRLWRITPAEIGWLIAIGYLGQFVGALVFGGLAERYGRVRSVAGAFTRYEAHRKPRTSRIQAISSANTWMKGGSDDTSWLYGYDAWTDALVYA